MTTNMLATLLDDAEPPLDLAPDLAPDLQLSPDQATALDTLFALIAHTLEDDTEATGDAADRIFVLKGYAGTGKTTIMRQLAARLRAAGHDVNYMAPTGKAAARLRGITGERVSTIHARLYGGAKEAGLCVRCDEWSDGLAKTVTELNNEWQRAVDQNVAPLDPETGAPRGVGWVCKHCGGWRAVTETAPKTRLQFGRNEGPICDPGTVLICDEASMVSKKIAEDLRHALPDYAALLYVGDDGQLAPIPDDDDEARDVPQWGVAFDAPTATLSTIHRQALASPVIQAAAAVRVQGGMAFSLVKDPEPPKSPERRWGWVDEAMLAKPAEWLATQRRAGNDAILLAYTHKTRIALNIAVRRLSGAAAVAFETGLPINPGDHVVITANNHQWGLYNGEVFTVKTIGRIDNPADESGERCTLALTFMERDNECYYIKRHTVGMLPREARYSWRRERNQADRARIDWEALAPEIQRGYLDFADYCRARGILDVSRFVTLDYGECLTIHKSQGSQWKYVCVVWDKGMWGAFKRDHADWQRLMYTAITRAEHFACVVRLKFGQSPP